jgi:hypothetical protein
MKIKDKVFFCCEVKAREENNCERKIFMRNERQIIIEVLESVRSLKLKERSRENHFHLISSVSFGSRL